ncbi:hypothetical protein IscW_ISCW004196 [Ixodes scapularis]|uniref:GH18 domain-containing protein n=1 Tax=Ixodes scapularis TaxID=6945 RepID=B7PJ20_IXOSC|nr:hypothetical protein IscW_ISCW004196 [Ixodes scapularis]|eukprot:XP_002406781.1 hypothetical protein IscW_ISCW004196 [Ixodes scapularis]
MKRLPSAVALVALFCAAAVPAAAIPEARKVLCYWNSWAFYRTGKGKSTPQRLDTAPCTHMVYNIVGIRGAEVVLSDPWNDLSDNGGNGEARISFAFVELRGCRVDCYRNKVWSRKWRHVRVRAGDNSACPSPAFGF